MNTVFKSLFFRQPLLHYVSPPACENLFSSSSGPIIVLGTHHLQPVTGLVAGGVGDFNLTWGTYPGAICYSVYVSPTQNGVYTIVAECIPNPEYEFVFPDGVTEVFIVVTAITPEGETPFGTPVKFIKPVPQCPSFVGAAPVLSIDANLGDTVVLGPWGVNEGIGFGEVFYWWFKDSVFYLDTTITSKNSLTLNDLAAEDAGEYTLQLVNNNPACFAESVPIAVNLAACPTIDGDPPSFDIDATVGEDVTFGPFSVDEGDADNVVYQWFHDGVFFTDTTSTTKASLLVEDVAEDSSGDWTLQISSEEPDPECFEESSPIALTVTPPGVCTGYPTEIADMVWLTSDHNIPCHNIEVTGGTGSFSLQTGDGCNGDSSFVDIGCLFCNDTAGIRTFKFSSAWTVSGGHIIYAPLAEFLVQVDSLHGGPSYYVYGDPFGALVNPMEVQVPIPVGPGVLRIYITLNVHGDPHCLFTGNISITEV